MTSVTTTLENTRFGTLAPPEEAIIRFPRGLLGFEAHTSFTVIAEKALAPFAQLQSLDDPDLAFVIVNPGLLFPHYKVEIDPREIAELAVHDLGLVTTWVIVTVPADLARMSANLQGPLLVNRLNNLGKQVVLVHSSYTTCHYIVDEMPKRAGRPQLESAHPVAV
ncbi:MAG: flagellar assembly protein FliW [candidate division Zixibacteria bacterium]|nr:flagellar assembly protein FliW [candidate division Zixibacteria bacterium]